MGVISILHLNDEQQIKRLKSSYKWEHDVALQLNTKQIRSTMDWGKSGNICEDRARSDNYDS
jgi:hypothetical protein